MPNKDGYPIDRSGHPITNGLFPTAPVDFDVVDAAGEEKRVVAPQAGVVKKITVTRESGTSGIQSIKLRMKSGDDSADSLVLATGGITTFPDVTVVDVPYAGGAETDCLYVFVDPTTSGSSYTVQFLIEKRVELP